MTTTPTTTKAQESWEKEDWVIIRRDDVFDRAIGNWLVGWTFISKPQYIIKNTKTGEIKKI